MGVWPVLQFYFETVSEQRPRPLGCFKDEPFCCWTKDYLVARVLCHVTPLPIPWDTAPPVSGEPRRCRQPRDVQAVPLPFPIGWVPIPWEPGDWGSARFTVDLDDLVGMTCGS